LIERVTDIRNALLHANFEQAAEQAGRTSVRDYFRNVYARDLEELFNILTNMMSQIDSATGRPYETPERRAAARARFRDLVVNRHRQLARRARKR
jgi:hypothetical protein